MSQKEKIKKNEQKDKKQQEEAPSNNSNNQINKVSQDDHKKALNKARHRSIELFSERMILKKALKQINYQKLAIEKQRDEIEVKNEKLNKALDKARKRTIDLFGKHIDLKKAKKYISIINHDVEEKNVRLEKSIKKAKQRTIELFGKHIDLKKAKNRIEYQSELLQKSYNELEIKNIQINDSLDYAKHIQSGILPPEEQIRFCFPDSFVFFRPKEVVSGDFYWMAEKKDNIFLAVVDCTGHGVPGAFMSMIGYTMLNQIVNENENKTTVQILLDLNKEIFASFYRSKKGAGFQNDGMDLTICKYNRKSRKLSISSAGHNFCVLSNNEIKVSKGCIFGIGEVPNDYEELVFKEVSYSIDHPVRLYMCTDGYTDQFGGDKNRKFSPKRLLYLIENNYNLPMDKQKRIFEMAFNQWKGKETQIDDVLLMGINFNHI